MISVYYIWFFLLCYHNFCSNNHWTNAYIQNIANGMEMLSHKRQNELALFYHSGREYMSEIWLLSWAVGWVWRLFHQWVGCTSLLCIQPWVFNWTRKSLHCSTLVVSEKGMHCIFIYNWGKERYLNYRSLPWII